MTRAVATAAAATLILAMSACGSDDEDGGGGGGGGGDAGAGTTLRIGLLSSYSGPAAAAKGDRSKIALNARLALYAQEGGDCSDTTFDIVTADDTSAPQGALAGAQRLVQQENVYALLDDSQLFFAAAPYMTTQASGTPVLGVATDGAPEWLRADHNLFPVSPPPLLGTPFTTAGEYLASQGGTKIGGVAFATPSSQQSLADTLESAEAAGLERGYVNDSMPLGSEDVSAIVLGIIDSGADALYLPINSNSIVAIAEGLKQANYDVKVILAATGYGASLLQSAPAVEASQGVSYSTAISPVEQGTDATERMRSALEDAGVPGGIPDLAHAQGWALGDLLIHGLELAGCDATQEEFIDALRDDDTWDDGGLYAKPFDFSDPTNLGQECLNFVKLEGQEFVPVESATPLCGEKLDS